MLFGLTSQCFTGDTLVSTESGLRPIEDIQAGDYVWSENTETGEKELKKVLAVSVTETDMLVHVTTETGTVINTTENHPFIVMPCLSRALPAQIVSRSEFSYDLLPLGRERLVRGIRTGRWGRAPHAGREDGDSCQR